MSNTSALIDLSGWGNRVERDLSLCLFALHRRLRDPGILLISTWSSGRQLGSKDETVS
jgi:hypothetical protein